VITYNDDRYYFREMRSFLKMGYKWLSVAAVTVDFTKTV
jgi:hypothetical protein